LGADEGILRVFDDNAFDLGDHGVASVHFGNPYIISL
jgi:hypothetical protein